jgi:hypothetical protein
VKPGRDAAGLLFKLGVAQAPVALHDRDAVGVDAARFLQEVRQRALGLTRRRHLPGG